MRDDPDASASQVRFLVLNNSYLIREIVEGCRSHGVALTRHIKYWHFVDTE